MKFTLSWLAEHLETGASLSEITTALTGLGLEVEDVADRARELKDFRIAVIKEASPHPNADKLRVCVVDAGEGDVQVVCGAPNARAGLKGVFAPPGAYVPGLDLTLKKAKIRGVESAGMMCSAKELVIGEDHDGIIELDTDAAPGTPAAAALGLDDAVIDIAITPNRGDCLGVHGVARDLAAAGRGELKPLLPAHVPGAYASPIEIALDFPRGAADACPHFVGRVIRGVRNAESPDWLQRKLRAVGLRPISALVDITNYFSIDRCRPLHVFDADTIAGNLTVRLARKGEKLAALDGHTYELDHGMCVIADEDGVLSLGGVMGGEASGCTEATVNVVLEAAYFDPVRTATTGRKLGIESDARFRFERGIDPASTEPAMEAATQLILDLCGGEAGEPVIAGAAPEPAIAIDFEAAEVARRGGLEIAEDRVAEILTRLGFAAERVGGALRVGVPTWRHDVSQAADLVEEVLRVAGYDAIPSVPLARPQTLSKPVETRAQRRTGFAKRTLAARGMVETVTYSFVAAGHARLFGGGADALRLANPISSELTDMRPSLLPALIAAGGRNADRGFDDLALFEVGPAYGGTDASDQSLIAGGIRAGHTGPRHWAGGRRVVDAFDAKADARAVLAECGAPMASLQTVADAPEWFHPGRSGRLMLGPKALAAFGEIHPAVLAEMDVAGPVVGFEVDIGAIPEPRARANKARGAPVLSAYQAVERDFAFLVDEGVAAEAVLRAALGADKALIRDATVFDVYRGEGVPEGKVSLAISVTLQPMEATLTEAEIEAVSAKITAAVEKGTGGTLRA